MMMIWKSQKPMSPLTTQTNVSKHELSYKLEAMMLRNNLTLLTKNTTATKIQSNLSYEVIKEYSNRMKHFVRLTSAV